MARPTATQTQNRILDAAERFFIKQGFAATSMREIAQASSTTNSLIVHHFGSKAQLWEQVKQRRMAHFFDQQQAFLSSTDLRIEQFVDAIRHYFELLKNDPALVQLLARAELEKDLSCTRFQHELVSGFVARIEEGQYAGIFSQQVKPANLLAMILCVVTQWMEARHQFARWPEMQDENDQDDSFLQDLIHVFLHGVLDRGNGTRNKTMSAEASKNSAEDGHA